MFAVICLGGALLCTALGLGSAGAERMRSLRLGAGMLPVGLMTASTLAMVQPMLLPGLGSGAVGSPIGWAAVLLAAALLALLDRRRRLESAMTAGGGVIMAVMWLAMAALAQGPPAAGGQLAAHLHLSAAAPFATVLGTGAVLLAAAHTALAVHLCRRQAAAARGIRIATLHHPAMSLGMLLMGLGMLA